jgi:hypothetical protein
MIPRPGLSESRSLYRSRKMKKVLLPILLLVTLVSWGCSWLDNAGMIQIHNQSNSTGTFKAVSFEDAETSEEGSYTVFAGERIAPDGSAALVLLPGSYAVWYQYDAESGFLTTHGELVDFSIIGNESIALVINRRHWQIKGEGE